MESGWLLHTLTTQDLPHMYQVENIGSVCFRARSKVMMHAQLGGIGFRIRAMLFGPQV